MDLHHNGATGSLKVEGPSYQKALYFRSGRILFGSSNDPRDQLGAILIETGTLTPEQLEDVNSKVGPGNPLAKVLSETGFVSQRELAEAARAKVERILSDVIAYTAGNFEFEDGVLPKGAVDLKLSTERLLLAAVRRVSDRSFVLRHLGGLDVVLAPTPGVRASSPRWRTRRGGLLPASTGGHAEGGAAATRLDEFEAAKMACTLLFLGLVRRATRRRASASPDSARSTSATAFERSRARRPWGRAARAGLRATAAVLAAPPPARARHRPAPSEERRCRSVPETSPVDRHPPTTARCSPSRSAVFVTPPPALASRRRPGRLDVTPQPVTSLPPARSRRRRPSARCPAHEPRAVAPSRTPDSARPSSGARRGTPQWKPRARAAARRLDAAAASARTHEAPRPARAKTTSPPSTSCSTRKASKGRLQPLDKPSSARWSPQFSERARAPAPRGGPAGCARR